jgi:hypothetical protein
VLTLIILLILCNTISITGLPFFMPMLFVTLSILNIVELRKAPDNVPKEYLLIENLAIYQEFHEKFLQQN